MNLEKRISRLEEKVLNKRSLNEARQLINFYESAFDINLPLVMEPLMDYWGLEGNWYKYVDIEEISYIADEAIVARPPEGWDPEEHSIVDVQKFAKLVTKKFVEDGHIDKSFLRKPLPKFDIEPLEDKRPPSNLSEFRFHPLIKNFIKKFKLEYNSLDSGKTGYVWLGSKSGSKPWGPSFYGNFGPLILISENEIVPRFELVFCLESEQEGVTKIWLKLKDYRRDFDLNLEENFKSSDSIEFKLFIKKLSRKLETLNSIEDSIDLYTFGELGMPENLINKYLNKSSILKSFGIETKETKLGRFQESVSFYLGLKLNERPVDNRPEAPGAWGPVGFLDGKKRAIFLGVFRLELKNKPTTKNLVYKFELKFNLTERVKRMDSKYSDSRLILEKSVRIDYIPGEEKEFLEEFTNFSKKFLPLHRKMLELRGKIFEPRFLDDSKKLPFNI